MPEIDNLGRLKNEVEDYVWIWSKTESTKLVIFVHGIFGRADSTWGNFPELVMSNQGLADVDWANWSYSSRIFDTRGVERVASKLKAFLQAHSNQYREIYFICHSMGGLVCRQVCADLGCSEDTDLINLYESIRVAIMLAVPGEGSWAARCLDWPIVRRLNARIGALANPEIIHSNFENSIAVAVRKGRCRPKFKWIDAEDDRLVRNNRMHTTDDEFCGIVSGNHNSLKLDQTADSTVVILVMKELIKSVSAGRRSNTVRHRDNATLNQVTQNIRGEAPTQERTIIIISCSNHKSDACEETYPEEGSSTLQTFLNKTEIVGELFRNRLRILSMIQEGLIDGVEFTEGNRISRPENKDIALGPDFGAETQREKYLPAWKRYVGRCFTPTSAENLWDKVINWMAEDGPIEVWIMSGMYGLFPAVEYIQNYDCHLSDINIIEGTTLSAYWTRAMTDVLSQRMAYLNQQGTSIKVIDLLTEESYRSTISWQRLYPLGKIYHAYFTETSGRRSLDNVGKYLAELIRNPTIVQSVEQDEPRHYESFDRNDKIGFYLGRSEELGSSEEE